MERGGEEVGPHEGGDHREDGGASLERPTTLFRICTTCLGERRDQVNVAREWQRLGSSGIVHVSVTTLPCSAVRCAYVLILRIRVCSVTADPSTNTVYLIVLSGRSKVNDFTGKGSR